MRSGRAWLPEPTTKVGPERRAWLPEPTTEVGPERRGLWRIRRAGSGARAGYFGAAGTLLQPGDLVYVRARASGEGQGGAAAAAVHMALLMVRAGPPGSVSVRLAQDFGRSDAPDTVARTATAVPAAVTAAPPSLKRSRGRPPGSRGKKNGAMSTMSVN